MSYNIIMDEEQFSELDDEFDGVIESVMPFLRIYISCGKQNHDLLEMDEIVDFLTSENRSINETIKYLIDRGMANVYASSFSGSVKVL